MITPTIVGVHDANTLEQMTTACAHPNVRAAVLMPDGHYGYGVPIGGVIAYEDAISPSGVGFDIGCGVIAIRTNLKYEDIADDRDAIADEIARQVEFGMGRTSDLGYEHPVLEDFRWTQLPATLQRPRTLAADPLGTVGSGNHYVDILTDYHGVLWVACHFGSRGFGHKTATYYLGQLGGEGQMQDPPKVIVRSENEVMFDEYVIAMTLAGDYARAGREIVADQVLKILGAENDLVIHNHHHYAWVEHGHWVVRKGATPAQYGVMGFVGGSMNDRCVIVAGRDESAKYLDSTVHGAGRVMSRTKAAGKYRKVNGKRVRTQGVITPEVWGDTTAGITLRGGGYDEAPDVYRNLTDVLDHLNGTIQVTHDLQPVIVCMAGADTYDAFKD